MWWPGGGLGYPGGGVILPTEINSNKASYSIQVASARLGNSLRKNYWNETERVITLKMNFMLKMKIKLWLPNQSFIARCLVLKCESIFHKCLLYSLMPL